MRRCWIRWKRSPATRTEIEGFTFRPLAGRKTRELDFQRGKNASGGDGRGSPVPLPDRGRGAWPARDWTVALRRGSSVMLSCRRGRIVNRIYGSTRISSGFRTNNAAIRINKDRTNRNSGPIKISKDLTSQTPQYNGAQRQAPAYPAYGGRPGTPAPNYTRPAYPNANRPGNMYQNMYPGAAPPGHLGDWLNRHQGLPAQDQERLLRNDPSFNRLPPATQQRLVQQLHQLNQLPEDQRERRLARSEMLEHMSPQDQMQVRQAGRGFMALPPDRQAVVKRAFQDLRSVPLDQRATVLNSARYQSQFSPDERGHPHEPVARRALRAASLTAVRSHCRITLYLLLKKSSDLFSPSFSPTRGSQPSNVRAFVMSGRRRVGSSTGSST